MISWPWTSDMPCNPSVRLPVRSRRMICWIISSVSFVSGSKLNVSKLQCLTRSSSIIKKTTSLLRKAVSSRISIDNHHTLNDLVDTLPGRSYARTRIEPPSGISCVSVNFHCIPLSVGEDSPEEIKHLSSLRISNPTFAS